MPRQASSSVVNPPKALISLSEMAEQLGMSRGHFYTMVEEGFFLSPIFLIRNKRPCFTAEMAERNRLAKEFGIGVDGSTRIFYRRRRAEIGAAGPVQATSSSRRRQTAGNQFTEMVGTLAALGLTATSDQVALAVADLFPQGVETFEESDVIRAIFRHLRRSESVR